MQWVIAIEIDHCNQEENVSKIARNFSSFFLASAFERMRAGWKENVGMKCTFLKMVPKEEKIGQIYVIRIRLASLIPWLTKIDQPASTRGFVEHFCFIASTLNPHSFKHAKNKKRPSIKACWLKVENQTAAPASNKTKTNFSSELSLRFFSCITSPALCFHLLPPWLPLRQTGL